MLLVLRLSNPDPGKDFLGRGALSERSLGRNEEQQRGGETEGRAAGNEATGGRVDGEAVDDLGCTGQDKGIRLYSM